MGDEPVALIGRNGMGKTTLCNAIMRIPPGARDGLDRLRGQRARRAPVLQDRRRRDRLRAPGPAAVRVADRRRAPADGRAAPRRAIAGRPTPSTSSSRAWPSAARTAACSSPAASSRCSRSAARCSATRRLLIMDEPSEGLAPTIIETLIETFRSLAAEGLAILVVEQNLAMATAMAERQLVMVAGRISAETTAAELVGRSRAAAPLPRRGARLMAHRRPRRHAGHQGRRVRLPARPPARGRRRRRCSSTPACSASRRSRPTWRARRSRARAAPTTPSSCAPPTAAPRSTPWGAARRRCSRGCTPRARLDGVGRGRRLGQLVDRRAGDARPAGRRAQADRLDRRLGRHAPLRRGRRRHDDVLGRRHLRDQPDLVADPHQRRRGDRRDGHARRCPSAAGERPLVGGDDVRRHHAVRHRARASAWRSSATRCSSSTPPAPAGSPSRRWPPAASSSACSTSRRPSWPTSSSAASCRPAPIAWRRSGAPASRRSSRSARWTWSTSARATPCRRSSRAATSTSTTRRSR